MAGSIVTDRGCNKLLHGLSQAVSHCLGEKIGVFVSSCAMCPPECEINPVEHTAGAGG